MLSKKYVQPEYCHKAYFRWILQRHNQKGRKHKLNNRKQETARTDSLFKKSTRCIIEGYDQSKDQTNIDVT